MILGTGLAGYCVSFFSGKKLLKLKLNLLKGIKSKYSYNNKLKAIIINSFLKTNRRQPED